MKTILYLLLSLILISCSKTQESAPKENIKQNEASAIEGIKLQEHLERTAYIASAYKTHFDCKKNPSNNEKIYQSYISQGDYISALDAVKYCAFSKNRKNNILSDLVERDAEVRNTQSNPEVMLSIAQKILDNFKANSVSNNKDQLYLVAANLLVIKKGWPDLYTKNYITLEENKQLQDLKKEILSTQIAKINPFLKIENLDNIITENDRDELRDAVEYIKENNKKLFDDKYYYFSNNLEPRTAHIEKDQILDENNERVSSSSNRGEHDARECLQSIGLDPNNGEHKISPSELDEFAKCAARRGY